MGCDIHMHVEIRKRDKWLLYNQPNIDRDYGLFEKMAGVRGHVSEAISPPKGLPGDVSEVTKIDHDYDGSDAHSESWLSLDEITALNKWWDSNREGFFEGQFGYIFGNGYDYHKYPNDLQPPIDDVRFVFWFDN